MMEQQLPLPSDTSVGGRILVIDDDPVVAGMLAVSLAAAGHEIIEANSGEEALAGLAAPGDGPMPDLVFLDIEMAPGIDGYETCRRLRELRASSDLPVIFLSGHDSLEDRLRAYDAGGSDFMAKPFMPEEVLRKADVAIRHQRQQAAHDAENRFSYDAAMAALNSLGEFGITLKFSRSALGCQSLRTLASLVIKSMQTFGLDCHVQLRTPVETLTLTQRGVALPLEISVIEKMRAMGRMFSFKNRMIANYDSVSILVTNMPITDEELCGRIRDHVAMIAEATELSASNISQRTEVVMRADELRHMADRSRHALEYLRGSYRSLQTATRLELARMTSSVDGLYDQLGLTNAEELTIHNTLRGAVAQVMALFEQTSKLDQQFAGIAEVLNRASEFCLFQTSLESASNDSESEAQLSVELW
jgi:CheY-like chemotaxis protein